MRKIGIIVLVGVMGIILYACGISTNEGSYKLIEAEDTVAEQVIEEQDVFEYDLVNNTITINGTAYDIATNEMDYIGGYMFYYMGNSDMENIMLAVNSQDLSKKYWRENFTEELLDKATESTELEDFIQKDGEILNFYILNSQDFLHSYYEVQMPIVVEYRVDEVQYNTILIFCMSAYTEDEEVVYRTTDILQRENLDEWKCDDKAEGSDKYFYSRTFQSYQEAYLALSSLCQLEGRYEDYNLIYFDEDDIPELVAGINGYYMSMYTYKDGIIYPLMDEWCYGAGGNHGYEYAPKKNSLRNYDTDYAGAILYTTYATVNEEFSMETIAEFKLVNFDDANGNGMLDANEEDSVGLYSVQYLNGKEVTGEEKAEYDQGVYENIHGTMSLEELQEKLEE